MNEALIPLPQPVGWRLLARRAGSAALEASLRLTPRPMALFIRRQFARSGRARTARLLEGAPGNVVTVSRDERYGMHRDALMDVYAPAKDDGAHPTIVW